MAAAAAPVKASAHVTAPNEAKNDELEKYIDDFVQSLLKGETVLIPFYVMYGRPADYEETKTLVAKKIKDLGHELKSEDFYSKEYSDDFLLYGPAFVDSCSSLGSFCGVNLTLIKKAEAQAKKS